MSPTLPRRTEAATDLMRVDFPLIFGAVRTAIRPEEIEKLKTYQEAQSIYRLTDGKPTKKDRRELDRFMDDWQED